MDPPPDASVPDAPRPPDATSSGDGGPFPDGGNPETGPGGGCCDASGHAPSTILLVVLVGLLVFRRGTTET
jgi:hypothetical protein